MKRHDTRQLLSKTVACPWAPTALPPKLSLKWLIKYINRKNGTILLTSSRSHCSFAHSLGSHLTLNESLYPHFPSLMLFFSIALISFWHIIYLFNICSLSVSPQFTCKFLREGTFYCSRKQWLAHSRCSINIYWMNTCICFRNQRWVSSTWQKFHGISARSSIYRARCKQHYFVQSTSQEREIRGEINHGKFVAEWNN